MAKGKHHIGTQQLRQPPVKGITSSGRIAQAIRDYGDAVGRLSWKGSRPPEEHEWIELWHKVATLRLRLLVGVVSPTSKNVKRLYNLQEQLKEARIEMEQAGEEKRAE